MCWRWWECAAASAADSFLLFNVNVSPFRLSGPKQYALPANLKLPTLWRVQLQSLSPFTKLSRKCCGLGFGIGFPSSTSSSFATSPYTVNLFSSTFLFAVAVVVCPPTIVNNDKPYHPFRLSLAHCRTLFRHWIH